MILLLQKLKTDISGDGGVMGMTEHVFTKWITTRFYLPYLKSNLKFSGPTALAYWNYIIYSKNLQYSNLIILLVSFSDNFTNYHFFINQRVSYSNSNCLHLSKPLALVNRQTLQFFKVAYFNKSWKNIYIQGVP